MPDALFYQPGCGISGDMHLAALVDLGVPEAWLRSQLDKLPVSAEYTLTLQPASKMGISGTQARVSTTDSQDHRHHSTIVKMIRQAGYPPAVEQRALAMFQVIADAEGKIHNVPPDKVHFHEVGAVDSIVDIVAAALCIDYLQPAAILCHPIEVGSGYVDCAHGRFPVPAPATQEILRGAPCTYGGVSGESTTPTGAAILAACVSEYSPQQSFTPARIGYGIGHKDFERPNVLRVAWGSYEPGAAAAEPPAEQTAQGFAAARKTQHKLEANIDDMSPEAYEPLLAALFAAGALDVYVQPIQMKKNRPAHTLVALCEPAVTDAVAATLLNHSTTIGLRIVPFEKVELPRETVTLATSLGDVQIKKVTQPDGRHRWKSEHADILSLSRQHGLDYPTVKRQLDLEISRLLESG